jgi:hypothetical protein
MLGSSLKETPFLLLKSAYEKGEQNPTLFLIFVDSLFYGMSRF